MTLAGFKGKNHWQQVSVRGADDAVDERITPDDLYQSYNERFRFTLDVAASASNAKTPRNYYTIQDSGLGQSWGVNRVWCNPPYSNIGAWIYKAHQEFARNGASIVMLLPANRTEQKWWQQFVEPHRDCGSFLRTEFIPRRRNFGIPGNEGANWKKGVPFGLVAVIFQMRHGRVDDELSQMAGTWP